MVRLDAALIRELLAQHESGMGYQLVDVRLRRGGAAGRSGIVLNGDVLLWSNELSRLTSLSYSKMLSLARSEPDIAAIRVLPYGEVPQEDEFRKIESFHHWFSARGADKEPIQGSGRNGRFKRFSAYENDRRVTSERGLLAGTYATTEEDAANVATGKQAVARYALPNSDPAIYVFTVLPPEKTPIQLGEVDPNYGQPGGGVEVIFVGGSPPHTVTGPETIPSG